MKTLKRVKISDVKKAPGHAVVLYAHDERSVLMNRPILVIEDPDRLMLLLARELYYKVEVLPPVHE